jgi:flagellar hook-associated protein 1
MVGLSSTLSIASQALGADSGALAITNNNIANANTSGYSRQIVHLSAETLTPNGSMQDGGVSYDGYTSVRDELLQIGINQKTSDASSLETQSTLWAQVETGFSSTSSGVGAALSIFFSNLSALATAPNNAASRQTAYSSAGQLVTAFHQAAAAFSSAASQADQSVAGTVAQINQLSSHIAALDIQLATTEASGQDGGSLKDQRDALTTQLAQLTGITSTPTSSTPSLAVGNGTPLVIGGTAYPLQVVLDTDGQTQVMSAQGDNITGSLMGGSLGGALQMRDTEIPQLSSKLDQLASDLATAVNTLQAQGYDQNGGHGQPLFALAANGTSAAAGITLAASTGASLAISSDGSAGSSGNLTNLLAVQTQALSSGESPTDTYASLVQAIGDASSTASGNLQATNTVLNQLTSQQASESGVSIDEETTNLLRYQQAYVAAAKVISTINELYSTLMNMS